MALLVLGTTPHASAQGKANAKPLAASLSPSARAAYNAARLLFGDGDYAGAALKFKEAYDDAKDARLLWNMAACEEKLRHYGKASALLNRYVEEAKGSISAQDRADAFDLIHTLAAFFTQLVVTTDVEGVDILVDGETVGTTPLAAPASIDQGMRHIVAKKSGYEDVVKDETVNSAFPVNLTLRMTKIEHDGHVDITAGPHDTIAIDGAVVAEHHYEGTVPTGGHQLRVTASGMRTYESELSVADGEHRTLTVTLEKDGPSSVLAWWLVGTGSVLVIGGATVGGYFLFKPATSPQPPVGTINPGTVQLSSLHPSLGRR
jgi:hypothetical protein